MSENEQQREILTLEEVRKAALEAGCTPAQFAHAVEAWGDDPADVAEYLKRHAFVAGRLIKSRTGSS